MAQSSNSSSDLDLSRSLVSAPLKHPAYTHPSDCRKPVRNNSTPNGWRPSYIPHMCHNYGDNKVRRNQSIREASKSLMNIDRQSSTNSSNCSEQDSPVNSRYRTLYWSTSLLYHSSSASSPKVSHKHLFCQIPEMDNPKKRLSKSPSIDSGTGSGSIRRKPISPGRKRNNSVGSASTTSSSSLGSLKEKLDKTEPVEVKKRSSLSSLISRKGSTSRRSSSSTSPKKSIADGEESSNVKTSKTDPSSLPPTPLVRSSSSSLSPAKVSTLRESLKAAKKLLTPSSKSNTESPKISFSKSSNAISEEAVCVNDTTVNEFSTASPTNNSHSGGSTGKFNVGVVALNAVKNSVREENRKHGSVSNPGKGTPGNGEKKQKEKDPNKTPTKKVLGKIFGKKSRGQNSTSISSLNQGESIQPQPETPVEKNSLKIVNLESEPRKIVPKPRIVTLSSNNRGFSEMEVSEEAVALARKLREEQKQREEQEDQMREAVGVIDEMDNDVNKANNFSSPPIPRPRRLSATNKSNEDDEQTWSPTLDLHSGTKESSEELTTVQRMENYTTEANVTTEGQSLKLMESALEEGSEGQKHDVQLQRSEVNQDESLPSSEIPSTVISSISSTPCIQVDDADDEGGNSRDLIKDTLESGREPPCLSLEDQLIGAGLSSNNFNADNPSNGEDSVEVETDNEDDNVSIATTVTTTASEMDTSFMLSRSLALTEDEFSYTESFKQLKPFNFDHVDPIPEGKRERLYKVLVVGELGTGKTSIIKRYVHQFFSQHYRATIGVDFALKVLRWDPETVVRLQLWDIAGQERFGSMTRVYYKEAVGAFVVFDVTRAATLEAVPKWKADLDTKVVLPDGRPIPTVLLANKSDQPKEGIAANREKMNEFCQQQGFSAWFETSAKDNINIDESANFLVSKILDMDKWSQEPIASDPEKLDLTANGKHKPGGTSNCAC